MHLIRKIVKIFIYILCGVFLLLFVASFFIDSFTKRLLENEVAKAGRGQYSLQLDEVSISLLRGDIILKGISFATETRSGELEPVIMADVTEFSAKGVSWLTFVMEKRLLIDELKLDGLDLRLTGSPIDTTQSGQPFSLNKLDVYPQIREHIRKLHLHDLALSNIDFTLINALTEDTLQFSANRLDLQSKDILIDADELITRERAFYAAFIDFDGKGLQLRRTGNASWLANMDRLHLFTDEDRFGMSVQAMHYLQSPPDSRDTLMLVELQHFDLRDLNLHKLREEEVAAVQNIRLTGLNIINGLDKPNPDNSKNSDTLEQTETRKRIEISTFTLGGFLPEFANSLELANLELKAISYRQGTELSIRNASLSASNILLDEKPAFAEERFLHAGRLQSSVDRFRFASAEAEHTISWNKLQLEAEDGIASLHIRKLGAESALHNNGSAWLNGEIGLLQLEAIDTRKLAEGLLQLGPISTEQLNLQVNMPPAGPSQEEAGRVGTSSPDLYPALDGMLQALSIESLDVRNGHLQLADGGGKLGSLSVPVINFQLNDILIDRESAFADGRLLHSREIMLDIQNANYLLPDQQNSLQLGNARLTSRGKSLRLRNLSYGALLPENEPAVESASRLSAVTTRDIDLRGINFQQLLMGEGLQAAALGVYDTNIRLGRLVPGLEQEIVLPPVKDGDNIEENFSMKAADLNAAEYLPAFIKTASIDTLAITGINIKEENGLSLENFRIHASAVRLDDKTAFAEHQFLHAKTFKAAFDTLWVLAGQPGHYVMTKDFQLSVDDGIGALMLGDVSIRPEDMPLNRSWVEATVPALIIPDINTRELSAGILRLNEVVVRKPEVVAYLPEREPEKNNSQLPLVADLYPLIEENLSEVRLGRLYIEKGEVRLAGLGGSYYGMSLHEIDMAISDFHIADGMAFDNNRILHAKDFDLSLGKLIMLFPNKVYSLELDALALNAKTQSLQAGSLRYMYNGNYNTILEDSARNDVYRLVSDGFKIGGLNYRRLFKNKEFYAQTVNLNGLDLYIYKDLNMPEAERVKPMPRDMVFNLGLPVSIDSLQVEDFAITYEEMGEGAESAGLVTLMEVSTTINHISNIHKELVKQPEMQVKAKGRLMGKGYFETQMEVPLLDEQKKLRIRGSIDTLDMSRLNRISRYNSRIAIQDGTLYKASWDFMADGELASGDFELSYEDLQVQLSSKNSPDTTGVLKDVGSFLANLLVVDSNIAPSKTKEPKKVTFEEKRNKQKSFFNFYVHSLLTGLLEAIGVPFQ